MKTNLITHSTFSFHFFFLFILSSCTTTKQLHQDKTNITTETSAQETTVSNSRVISITKIIESQDTSVLVKGSEVNSFANLNTILSGDTVFASGENLLLKTFYDSLTKTIKTQAIVKFQTVSFKYQKITEQQLIQTGNITSTKQEDKKQMVQSNGTVC